MSEGWWGIFPPYDPLAKLAKPIEWTVVQDIAPCAECAALREQLASLQREVLRAYRSSKPKQTKRVKK